MAACSASSDTAPSSSASSSTAASSPPGLAAPAWAKSERFVARVDAAEHIALQVHLQIHDEAGARAELAAISDPDNARYGQFLSTDEFAARYAPTEADVAVVRAHFEAAGLQVVHVPTNRAYIAVEGTTAQAEAAFSTHLGAFAVKGEKRRAPIDAATLPDEVAARVRSVFGLATTGKMKPSLVRAPAVAPSAATSNTCSTYYGQYDDTTDPAYGGGFPNPLPYGQCAGYVPAQIRRAYGFEDTVRAGLDGRGQTIAILDAWLSPTLLQDSQEYATNNDPDFPLQTSQFTATWAPGTPVSDPHDAAGWYGEVSLDVQAVHAIAPGANIAFIAAQSDSYVDLLAGLNLVVSNHLASVISNSWSGLEIGLEPSDTAPFEALSLQAGLVGIGLYFATGDNGDSALAYGLPAPSAGFPCTIPEITAVGGTSVALGKHDQVLFATGWESGVSFIVPQGYQGVWTGPDLVTSVHGSGRQIVFPADTTTADGGAGVEWWPAAPGGYYYGSGGGTSVLYAQPDFQRGIVPSAIADVDRSNWRVIPDVSMVGDPETGFQVGETVSGVYSEGAVGGTSLATPLFTASMALAQQVWGHPFGAANRVLYRSSRIGGFQDIAPTRKPQAIAYAGGVAVTFDYAGPGNTLVTTPGFDNVSGIGSPNGAAFFLSLF